MSKAARRHSKNIRRSCWQPSGTSLARMHSCAVPPFWTQGDAARQATSSARIPLHDFPIFFYSILFYVFFFFD
jgi:hypothetical protein